MPDHLNLVRFRNDGDEFHVLWTARRALRMLDPSSRLVAVTVEGVSGNEPGDATRLEAGLLVIDTAEYYGSEDFSRAEQVVYCQLKYSTKTPGQPWTLSGLAGTLAGFARRYEQFRGRFGPSTVEAKLRFRFVTNRPIADAVTAAHAAVLAAAPPSSLSADARRALGDIVQETGLDGTELAAFTKLLEFRACEGALAAQQHELRSEVAWLMPIPDVHVTVDLKDLVRRKALSASQGDPTIRRTSVLQALDVVDEAQLLPAPPSFADLGVIVARTQEGDQVDGPGRLGTRRGARVGWCPEVGAGSTVAHPDASRLRGRRLRRVRERRLPQPVPTQAQARPRPIADHERAGGQGPV